MVRGGGAQEAHLLRGGLLDHAVVEAEEVGDAAQVLLVDAVPARKASRGEDATIKWCTII